MSKVSWKTFIAGFQLKVFENKRTFMRKVVLHTTTLVQARKVLRDLFSTNQGNGSQMRFVPRATKINLTKLKN